MKTNGKAEFVQYSTNALDEVDQAILHAMQVSPRAPWTEIAKLLDIDAATVGRRWDQLRSTGRAWTTCYPTGPLIGRSCMAFLEIDVQAGEAGAVGRTLAAYPHVVTVEHMAGGRDLLVTVMCRDLGMLSKLVSERIAPLPGVVRTRANLATRLFTEGAQWRLRVLTAAQQRCLTRPSAPASHLDPADLDGYDHRLITVLSGDARAPAVELARQVGLSAPSVRKRMARMVHSGNVGLRCEVAGSFTAWPISATLWASVPPGEMDKVAHGLGSLSELRMCASVTGPQNLLFTVWLTSLADLGRLERLLAERLPQIQLVDRSVALHQVKLMGRLLDERGQEADCVPIDPWLEPGELPWTVPALTDSRK